MVPASLEPVVQTAHWINSITMMMRKQKKKTVHIANSPMLPYLRNWM